MTAVLRMCLFDATGLPAGAFRAPFAGLPDVQIMGEFDTWERLQDIVHTGAVQLVAINLDSATTSSLSIVQHLSEVAPDCAMLGVSRSSDPQTIIAAMRAGCAQFVAWPIDPADLQSAIDRIRATRAPQGFQSQRYCVIGSSGGVGSTTIACNLAIELAHFTSQASALVDLNLEFGDVGCDFDCDPPYSIADVCRDGVEVDRTMLESALHVLPCNVAILARPRGVDDARHVMPDAVAQMFHVLGTMYPYVVADLPRNYGFLAAAAVNGADRILIVSQLSVPFLRNARRIYESLMQMGAPQDRIEIVLNRCNANFERIKPEQVAEQFGRPVFAVVPNDYRRVGAARDMGQPMLTDAPNSPARLAIQSLAKQLSGADAEKGAAAGGGLLGMFRKRKPAAAKPVT